MTAMKRSVGPAGEGRALAAAAGVPAGMADREARDQTAGAPIRVISDLTAADVIRMADRVARG